MSHDITVALIAGGAVIIPSIIGLLNRAKINEVHVMMNSRFSEMIELTKEAWYAKGHLAGQGESTSAEKVKREETQ